MVRPLCLGVVLAACQSKDPVDPDETSGSDTATGAALEPAPLAAPSGGGCPSFGAGPVTFVSDGLERRATVITPADPEPGLPVAFVFHGLTSPQFDPMGSMVEGLGLRAEAEARRVIFVIPEARPVELPLVGVVSLWGILGDEAPDLRLYDDLRTCVIEAFDADTGRVSAFGHSGGALWTTVVAANRADTLAAFGELSGGADIEIPLLGGPFVVWAPSGIDLPALLVTGGSEDVWPDTTFTLIDFTAATDTLTEALVAEGQAVTRCEHGRGHYVIPPKMLDNVLDFALGHQFGRPNPSTDDTLPDDCWRP